MLGFTCRAVRGFPSIAPCLEHLCAGGGGGSVAFEGFLLYAGGVMLYTLIFRILCYLCKLWPT